MSNSESSDTSIWLEINDDPLEALRTLPNKKRLELARDALKGGAYPNGEDVHGDLFHHWLNWIQSEDPWAILWWYWANEQPDTKVPYRDEYIIKLWHTMNEEQKDLAVNRKAKEHVIKEVTVWSYFEQHFFNWFLDRYNIVDARQVYNKNWISRYIHLLLSLFTSVSVGWYFLSGNQSQCQWLIALLSVVLIFTLGNVFAWIKPGFYLQSLIPRLAVTTGIGYLFLFSASSLVKLIYLNPLDPGEQIIISLALVLLVLLYMMQVILRAVQPRPKLWIAFKRALNMLALAITYSFIGLLICAPILYHPVFLDLKSLYDPAHPLGYLLITAAITLAIGVVLQLVWEDKPITKPL
ncbi:MAG: hypothetical protein H6937_13595 [Burkholderiales bacterium]|nr:hypothetical protein [Burkholderiales bacterium]